MSSRTIRIIILLAAALFAGIAITQVYWVRKAFQQEKTDFNRNVNLALYETAQNFYKITGYTSPTNNPIINPSPNNYVVMVNSPIDANFLEVLLKTSFSLHNLFTDFDYAVFERISNKKVFEKHVKAGPGEMLEPETKLPIFNEGSYYFHVRFPAKNSIIADQMKIWTYSTISIVAVILFFAYALFVILKQKRLSEIQKDFINNMTHEFKTPISTIEIASSVLKDPSIRKQPERLLKYATIIENENNRLKNQVDKVLQTASLETGTIDIKKESIDMHDLIENVIRQLTTSMASDKVEMDFNSTNYVINADRVHITNIVYNLLENAIKYSQKSGMIRVETSSTSGSFRMEFKDQGPGISESNLKHVFDKFYRVPKGNLHDIKGFGIGLHYVKLITEAHKGHVSVHSEIGKGSTFTVDLPF